MGGTRGGDGGLGVGGGVVGATTVGGAGGRRGGGGGGEAEEKGSRGLLRKFPVRQPFDLAGSVNHPETTEPCFCCCLFVFRFCQLQRV